MIPEDIADQEEFYKAHEADFIKGELRKIITIDGRGRPKKAEILQKLLQGNDIKLILEELEEIKKLKY